MKLLMMPLVLVSLLWSCTEKQKDENQTADEIQEVSTEHSSDSTQYLGEAFTIEQVVAVNELQTKIAEGDSAVLIARGTLKEVCQAKGCWMTLELPNQNSMRVTFKDYGFFMPKDLAGKEVIMKGTASYTTTDVETLQHLAEDGGKSAEEIAQITEPEVALTFLASGVTIVE